MGSKPAMQRSPVQEEHIDFLLEEEFCCNSNFLNWFLKTGLAGGATQQEVSWQPSDKHGSHAVRSVTTERGESDVLVTYRAGDEATVALLIEDKIGAVFQDAQAARYRERGEDGVAHGEWDRFATCLVSPARYAQTCTDFDMRVSLEQLAQYFQGADDARSRFKADVLEDALAHYGQKGPRKLHLGVTAFRAGYAVEAEKRFSKSGLQWDLPRDAWWGDYWFRFNSKVFGKGVHIMHKAHSGFVDLVFENTGADKLAQALSSCQLPQGTTIISTGKSASLRLRTTPIENLDIGTDGHRLPEAFSAVSVLFDFYRKSQPKPANG